MTGTAGITRYPIGERLRRKVGYIRERKDAAKIRLRRAISFLFTCEAGNPYSLTPAMGAGLYL